MSQSWTRVLGAVPLAAAVMLVASALPSRGEAPSAKTPSGVRVSGSSSISRDVRRTADRTVTGTSGEFMFESVPAGTWAIGALEPAQASACEAATSTATARSKSSILALTAASSAFSSESAARAARAAFAA